jgi:hypothetical protein
VIAGMSGCSGSDDGSSVGVLEVVEDEVLVVEVEVEIEVEVEVEVMEVEVGQTGDEVGPESGTVTIN